MANLASVLCYPERQDPGTRGYRGIVLNEQDRQEESRNAGDGSTSNALIKLKLLGRKVSLPLSLSLSLSSNSFSSQLSSLDSRQLLLAGRLRGSARPWIRADTFKLGLPAFELSFPQTKISVRTFRPRETFISFLCSFLFLFFSFKFTYVLCVRSF